MKKLIGKTFILFIFILLLRNSIVSADMGPKPSITINLKGINTTNYIIDLLVYDEEIANQVSSINSMLEKKSYSNISEKALLLYYKININDSNGDENSLPIDKLVKLAKINDNGWVSESTRWSKFLLMSDIIGNSKYENYFRYFGTPEKYKVVIINNDTGETKITDVINREDFNSQITIDVKNMKVTNNVILSDTSKNIIVPLIITIFIELLISLIFIKKNVYNFIIIVITNAVTNSIMQYILRNTTYGYGSIFMQHSYLGLFILLEIIITLVEMFIYNKTIKDTEKESIIKYTLVANFITMLLTGILAFII